MTSILVGGLFWFGLGGAWAMELPAPGRYQLSPEGSEVGFSIRHLLVSSTEGHFDRFTGSVEVKSQFEQLSVEGAVEVASVNTGFQKRDRDIQVEAVFDTVRFPKMTFKSTGVEGTPESFRIRGDLQIKATQKPVVFECRGRAGPGERLSEVTCETRVNRMDYGVKGVATAGDEVVIRLRARLGPKQA